MDEETKLMYIQLKESIVEIKDLMKSLTTSLNGLYSDRNKIRETQITAEKDIEEIKKDIKSMGKDINGIGEKVRKLDERYSKLVADIEKKASNNAFKVKILWGVLAFVSTGSGGYMLGKLLKII